MPPTRTAAPTGLRLPRTPPRGRRHLAGRGPVPRRLTDGPRAGRERSRPQPGAPEVSAGRSQPGRHRRLHSPGDEELLTVGGRGRRGGPRSSRDAPPRWLPPPPPPSSLLGVCPLRASRCPEVQPGPVRPSRSPSPAPLPGGEPRGAQAPPAASRTRGRRGIPARPPVRLPLPGAWCTLSAGRGGPAPAWRAASSPGKVTGTAEPSTERLPPARPPLPLPAWPQRPLGAALLLSSLCTGARRPPPSLSARLPPSPSFLASFLPCLPPLPRCQPSPAGSLRRPVPGCPLRVSGPRLPGAAPSGPRRRRAPGRPPLPFRGCRERGARHLSAPGSAAAAVTVCLCHVCAWAGGGAGRGGAKPADTPPSDRRRAPNQQRPSPRPARPRSAAPRAATPGPGRRGQRARPAGAGCAGRAGSAVGGRPPAPRRSRAPHLRRRPALWFLPEFSRTSGHKKNLLAKKSNIGQTFK
ncbi:basic proline-rich protein-like [Falco biarmicus]|uniref:basic proline-rich protein-like n=1 Tax=Falco biarmicus TaxID=345155 RepID=UPI0024BC9A79|nr:basic proline-rich protein-like [Falco biarmicus]